MLHVGQQSAFPKLMFLANRLKVERIIERGRRGTRVGRDGEGVLSEDEVSGLWVGSGSGEEGATASESEEGWTGDEAGGSGSGVGEVEREEQALLDEQLREFKMQ